jgi:hypothetical protein
MPSSFGSASFANYKYSIYCTYTPGGTASGTLGNTEVYLSTSTAANRRAIQVTASENGQIESISIYHNGGSGALLLGVYSDASGSPQSLLDYALVMDINETEGWQTVSLPGNIQLTTGQTVWLSWVFESNPGIRYISGNPPRAQSPEAWSGGMPVTFGAASFANYKYSIYCTYYKGNTKSIKSDFLTANSVYLEEDKDKFLIYPNPTSGMISVTWNNIYDNGLVLTMLNSTGASLKVMNIEGGQRKAEVDLGGFDPGLYLIMLTDTKENKVIFRGKVIKSR